MFIRNPESASAAESATRGIMCAGKLSATRGIMCTQSYPDRLYNTAAISCRIAISQKMEVSGSALFLPVTDVLAGCTTLLRGSLVLLRRVGICMDFVPRWITCKRAAFGNFGLAGVLRPTGILALLPSALPCKGDQRD